MSVVERRPKFIAPLAPTPIATPMRTPSRWTLVLALATTPLLPACSWLLSKDVPKSEEAAAGTIHALKVESLDAGPVEMSQYKGEVLLVVNVASECGFTPQYEGLEALNKELAPKGFRVLGFPSNEFGGQEPGSPAEIRKFCTEKFAVDFPLFAKVTTQAGPEQSPVYAFLGGATGKLPNWNFGKYLVGRDGRAISFYTSQVKPDDAKLRADIEAALAASR